MLALVLACSTAPEAEPPEESTTIAAAVSTTSIATVVSMPPFPAQPEGVPWPTAEWVVAEWPAQVDKSIVDEATDVAFADGSPDRVRAVVIAHEGAVVYERYSPSVTDGPDVVMPSYSMAKSVAAALVGIVVREGQLELDQAAPVPEWHADTEDPRSAITVEQMLHMSTGMEWSDGLDAGTNMSALVASPDAAGYAAAQQPTWVPGERFEYNSGTSTLLARIVGDAAGEDASDMRAFMEEELFDVIGIDPVETQFDDAGTWMGAFSADTTARDYAKFGLLHLRGGQWDGAQVLPRSGSSSFVPRARPARSTGATGGWTQPDRGCSTRWDPGECDHRRSRPRPRNRPTGDSPGSPPTRALRGHHGGVRVGRFVARGDLDV